MILVRETLPWLDIDYRRKESSPPLKLLWHYFRAPEHKDASTDFGGISWVFGVSESHAAHFGSYAER